MVQSPESMEGTQKSGISNHRPRRYDLPTAAAKKNYSLELRAHNCFGAFNAT